LVGGGTAELQLKVLLKVRETTISFH
jgi:hypothetical protein